MTHSATVIFTHFNSLWLTLDHSGSLRLTLALSLAFSGAYQLKRSLLGSLRRSCIAPFYPALLLMLLRLVFYTICKWWNKSLRNVGSMRRCGFKRSEIYEVQQFQFLFHHILQLPFHHILRHLHFSRALLRRPDLELFLGILRHSDLCHTSFEALCVSSTSLLTQ